MPRTKVDFEVRVYKPNYTFKKENLSTIEEASKLTQHNSQCTWEETQTAYYGYSHIIEYRDDEQYNDMYFI